MRELVEALVKAMDYLEGKSNLDIPEVMESIREALVVAADASFFKVTWWTAPERR